MFPQKQKQVVPGLESKSQLLTSWKDAVHLEEPSGKATSLVASYQANFSHVYIGHYSLVSSDCKTKSTEKQKALPWAECSHLQSTGPATKLGQDYRNFWDLVHL